MKTIAEIQILPVGSEESVREEVERANRILSSAGLKTQVHAMGTDVEGELEEVFWALKLIHERLHDSGVGRLATVIKLGTRGEEEHEEHAHDSEASSAPTDTQTSPQTSPANLGRDSFVTVWQMSTPAH